jgi:4-hydroxy-tetrahydrodipicolinate synthase
MTATGLAGSTSTAVGELSGVWCPALTPVDADLRPDAHRLIAHARWLLRSGCHGLVLFGTTGEANSFSVEERTLLLEAALEGGLPRERMLVGTGCCALSDTVKLTGHALSRGVAGVLMLPPFYYKDLSDEALFASFDQVIQKVETDRFKLYLYHFPRLSGVPITPGLIERLRRRYPDTVAGVKDSSGDWQNTRMLIERFPELAIFPAPRPCSCPGSRRVEAAASARRATSIRSRSASSTTITTPARAASRRSRMR